MIDALEFAEITADAKSNWLDQSDSNFEELLPLANRETKFAKTLDAERAVFKLNALGVNTARDEWVYDFDARNLREKVLFFADTYNELLDHDRASDDPIIKWSEATRNHFRRGRCIVYNEANRLQSLHRPFILKHYFADEVMNDRLTSNHYEMFGASLRCPNEVINLCMNGKSSYVLGANKVTDWHFTGDTHCLPLYGYTSGGERISNITQWGLKQFREHYAEDYISAEGVFAYIYAMLHDPAYCQRYAVDLRRDFPRVYFQEDFDWWAQQGRELLDLHLGFETVEPWPLQRVDKDGVTPKRAILRADKERNVITMDEQTTLAGVPDEAWEYRLGGRSALEWVLDQYKERKPRDPTIRERFNTYRFADYKEHVVDLLGRVCAVSAFTTTIVNELRLSSAIEQD